MTTFTALYDANILYPAPLRDLFVRLTFTDLFSAKWTNDIHDEWIRNLLKNRTDLSRARLEQTRRKMDAVVEDALVTDYEGLIPALLLPDPDDRHMLAAAITCAADVIVTYNLKDFPTDALKPYGLEAQHPDVFVSHLLDLDTQAVLGVMQLQRVNLKKPPKSPREFIETFRELGLSQTVSRLEAFEHLL